MDTFEAEIQNKLSIKSEYIIKMWTRYECKKNQDHGNIMR